MEDDTHSIISALFEEHAESIFRFATLSLPRDLDAKDVVQEVFLKAYRSWNTYNKGSNERTWLYQIAKNHIYA
ncbi:RNA polymerase sigma factor [Alicyclobacillus dauci]|uniref:RNA polymerase sigma-70 region 2 domain-containing protein n=1 Tax=Alicyclobacillus dauci TaxID=1475485 RepID=A0ABY6Z5W4_9BACL|nr:sigma factor [Alicyclobacillus dauci]WAH38053.1 hypothetical protein NZD86_06080 [Alicyclobacillus dauci]